MSTGWYVDPYKRHSARWFTDDRATDLVSDNGVESRDQPPAAPYGTPLERVPANPSLDGRDLRRADEACQAEPYDPKKAAEVAFRELVEYPFA